MSPNLITFADVQTYCELSSNMNEKKYNSSIWEAEEIDIQNALGTAFYYDLIQHKTDSEYAKLLAGVEYIPIGGTYKLFFRGLKPAIAYFAYARIMTRQNQESTAFGQVTKLNQYSNPVPDKTIVRDIETARATAQKFLNDAILYLNNTASATVFAVWKSAGNACAPLTTGQMTITPVGGDDQYENYFDGYPVNRDSRYPYRR